MLKARLLLAFVLMLVLIIFDFSSWVMISVAVLGVLVVGYEILGKAMKDLCQGKLAENVLMSIGAIAAIGIGEYPEGIAILLFYQIGELFEHYATHKSRGLISSLTALRPKVCHLLEQQGQELTTIDTKPQMIAIGCKIRVFKGERVPLDGILLSEHAELDASAITGESFLQQKVTNEPIVSGAVNVGNPIDVTVTHSYYDSTLVNLLNLIENATVSKTKEEVFIRQFAKIYTPVVISCAVVLALVPLVVSESLWTVWIQRALIFLVVSCPCALLLSVPLVFFGAIGTLAKQQILVKGSYVFTKLSKLNFLALDKTGTLTTGNFQLSKVIGKTNDETLRMLTYLIESNSNHPIAKSLCQSLGQYHFAKEQLASMRQQLANITEITGFGMQATFQNEEYYVVSPRYVAEYLPQLQAPLQQLAPSSLQGVLVLCTNKAILELYVLADSLKEGVNTFVQRAKDIGIKLAIVSGDSKVNVQAVATELNIAHYQADCSPADKLNYLQAQQAQHVTAFAGDGINDAPVLAQAHVGIAMGMRGQEVAMETADMIVMNDKLENILLAKVIAKRVLLLVWGLITFILSVKFVILFLGACGYANMWLAIFGDVGLTIISVLIAMQTFNRMFTQVSWA